jgi:hypothetical protein
MASRVPASQGYDSSNRQLARSQLGNPLRDFLKNLATRDRVHTMFDFVDWGETANFTLAQTQTSVNFTVIDAAGGVMAGTAVGVTTATISAIGKTRFTGSMNCDFEARWKINTVASTYIVEAGWVTAAPATGAAVVLDIDTAGATAAAYSVTNAAILGIWADQTHASFAAASIGSFTGQTVATTLLTASNSLITAPSADTYVTVRVLLLANETGKAHAYFWLNGKLVASHAPAAGAVNATVALYPWFYVQAVAATARIPTVDYIRLAADRGATE